MKESAAPQPSPLTRIDGLLLLLFLFILLLQFLPLTRSSFSWEDETLHASTSLALLRGRTQATVLADFPGTHSLLGFYGPVTFWMGELAYKLFGFSRLTWRGFCFTGNVLLYTAVFLAVRTFGFSRRLALAALVLMALSLEESLLFTTSGRSDVWAIGGVLLGTIVMLGAAQQAASLRSPRWWAGGALAGIFLACTPRVWLLWFAASAMLFLQGCLSARWRRSLLPGVLLANAAALAVMTLVLLPIHSNPLALLHAVSQGSQHDKVNASPLLGGSWGFGGTRTQVLFYAVILLLLCAALLRRPRLALRPAQRWFTWIALLNAALQILLLARSFNVSGYWGPVVFLSFIAAAFAVAQSDRLSFPARTFWLGGCAVLLCFLLVLRAARFANAVIGNRQDNSAQVRSLLAQHTHPGDVVYGPEGLYFFPSEQIGDSYRYAEEITTPALNTVPNVVAVSPLVPTLCAHPAFVLWPQGPQADPMPTQLQQHLGPQVAGLPVEPARYARLQRLVSLVPAGNMGVGPAAGVVLYKLQPVSPEACANAGASRASQSR